MAGVEITSEDWIVAINPKNDVVVGAQQWVGANTAVPVMGDEGGITLDGLTLDCDLSGTCDYMEHGDIPRFAIFDHSELTLIINELAPF